MRIELIGTALALSLASTAMAQEPAPAAPTPPAAKPFSLAPTESCTPFSRNVILGLCTKTQEAQAKQMIADGSVAHKPSAAPEPGEADVMLRLKGEELALLDAWISRQPDRPSRVEAVRRLMQKGLGG